MRMLDIDTEALRSAAQSLAQARLESEQTLQRVEAALAALKERGSWGGSKGFFSLCVQWQQLMTSQVSILGALADELLRIGERMEGLHERE